jgi:type I restriction enzyme, S subunit
MGVSMVINRVDAISSKDDEPYIALDDMPSKSIDLSNFRSGSEVNSSIIRFKKNDILFGSMRPYFHKVGLAPFDRITRTATFVLRPKKPEYRLFVLLHLSSNEVIEFSTIASVGTTIPYIKWATLSNYQVFMPPDLMLINFEKLIRPLIEMVSANGKSIHALFPIREALLPKLLSGEIRIENASNVMVDCR